MRFLKGLLYVLVFTGISFALFYKFWFLRQPKRQIPYDNAVLVSPANGKVVSVRKWNSESLQETKGDFGVINVWTKDVDTAGTIISIQMDPTNVHYQRAPAAGKLLAEKYTKGSFNNAVEMSNEYGIRFENEHNEMLFETNSGKRYKVIQIAGFLARRIEDYVTPEQHVIQGEIIGLIKLGSQVTVIFPQGVDVAVKEGDIVTDGETGLATIQ